MPLTSLIDASAVTMKRDDALGRSCRAALAKLEEPKLEEPAEEIDAGGEEEEVLKVQVIADNRSIEEKLAARSVDVTWGQDPAGGKSGAREQRPLVSRGAQRKKVVHAHNTAYGETGGHHKTAFSSWREEFTVPDADWKPVVAVPTATPTSDVEDKVLAILHEFYDRNEHVTNGAHLVQLFREKWGQNLRPKAGFNLKAWLQTIRGVKVYQDASCWYPMYAISHWTTQTDADSNRVSVHSSVLFTTNDECFNCLVLLLLGLTLYILSLSLFGPPSVPLQVATAKHGYYFDSEYHNRQSHNIKALQKSRMNILTC